MLGASTLAQSEVTVGGSLQGWEVALLLAVVGAVVMGLAWPLLRALARRIEGKQPDELIAARLEQFDQATRDLISLEARFAELEQRLDFAERMLPRPDQAKGQPSGEETRRLSPVP